MYNALEYANYNSNLASLQMRNKIAKYWPKVTIDTVELWNTDISIPDVEVFDRLYLLWDDVYITLEQMEKIGNTTQESHALVLNQTVKVGDEITYTAMNRSLYPDKGWDSSYVGNQYTVTDIVKKLDYISIPDGTMLGNIYTDVTEVKVTTPVKPFQFTGGGLDDKRRKELLLDEDGIKARKYIYKQFGIEKVIEEAKWKELDKVWLKFEYSGGLHFAEDTYPYHKSYKDGADVGSEIEMKIAAVVPFAEEDLDLPTDERNAKYTPLLMDKIKEDASLVRTNYNYSTTDEMNRIMYCLATAMSNTLLSDTSSLYSDVSEFYSPIIYYTWYGAYNLQDSAYISCTVKFKVVDHLSQNDKVFDEIIELAKNADKPGVTAGSYSSTAVRDTNQEGFLYYVSNLIGAATAINPGAWLLSEYGACCWGSFSRFALKTEEFKHTKVKTVQDYYKYISVGYERDSSNTQWYMELISVVVVFAIIIVAMSATSGAAAFGIPTVMIALGASTALIVMQIALSNAGYSKAAFAVGMYYKFYGYMTMAQGAIAQVIKNTAMIVVLKEVMNRVTKQIGGSVAIVLNSVIAFGGSILGKGSINNAAIGHGMMAAANAGMATDTQLSLTQMSDYRLTKDEQELLDEIDAAELEKSMSAGTAGFIAQDQNLWNSYHEFDSVDKIEDRYLEFEDLIDSKMTKMYS